MKVWRKLSKAGAVQIKGAVYILPMNEEHYEFFQWLASEVTSMDGEAAFTRVEAIDSMKDYEIMDIFDGHKDEDYQAISRTIEDLETKMNSFRKGSGSQNLKSLSGQVIRVSRSFEEVRKTDFFSSKRGNALRLRIDALNAGLRGVSGVVHAKEILAVTQKRREDYQGRVWVSRKRPFVDRMSSSWLIRRFVDKSASFHLVAEKDLASIKTGQVTFDVRGGEFTHVGDLCTFEVLVKTFGIKDKAVRKIAEIVHELDIKDDKYQNADASGIGEILSGLRKAVKDDAELLEKGISVFEMLYRSKAG